METTKVTKHVQKLCRLALGLIFSASLLAYAQGPAGAPGGGNQEMMEKLQKMSAELQLTPQQKKQVLPILEQEAPKMKAIKADTSLGPMQKAMKLKQVSNETDTKLQPILTPQQYQKLQQMHAQEREQMMQKMEQH